LQPQRLFQKIQLLSFQIVDKQIFTQAHQSMYLFFVIDSRQKRKHVNQINRKYSFIFVNMLTFFAYFMEVTSL